MKPRSATPFAGRNPLALCVALALLAGACAAPPLLHGQAVTTNTPAPSAAASAVTEAAVEAARAAYYEDARTNHIRLEKPIYTNAPYSEFRLRAAALAGDGYAASLCSGTNEAERSFWRRLAATNGWVPAQIRLAKEYESSPTATIFLRHTNGTKIAVSVNPPWSVDYAMKKAATNFPGSEFLETVRRPALELARDAALAKAWQEKAQAALPKLKADAARTNGHALLALAILYAWGDLVQSNQARSMELTRQAAELGLAPAQAIVAHECESTAVDKVQAARWYYLAATQGLAFAQASLASLHGLPWNWKFDPRFQPRAAAAVRWHFEVAHQPPAWDKYDAGYDPYGACCDLGRSYQSGSGVESNRVEAVRWFRRAADVGGDKSGGGAEYQLALCYFGGDGVPQSDTEGLQWLKVATERGYKEDREMERGLAALANSQQDYHTALRYWRKLAAQGEAWAQYSVGLCYDAGIGVAQSWSIAIAWFREAADQGHPAAQRSLGCYYREGKDPPRDFAQAATWPGDSSLSFLAMRALPRDFVQAASWFRRSAEQGCADAQNDLGCAYTRGEGVPQDYVEAYKWFNLAAAQGDSFAGKNRDGILSFLTPSQIAEAQRLSREFVARKEQSGANSVNELGSNPAPKATGTAFFITDAGHLLTAAHVVEKAGRIQVSIAGKTYPASLVKADKANDVAVLKVDGTFKALPLAASRGVKLGDTVFTIGFPNTDVQGTEPKLTKGEISSLAGIQDDPRHFQISAPVQPGNSGGPLVDLAGNVVGLVTARLGDLATLKLTGSLPQNVNYALKTSFIIAFLETLPDVAAKLKEPETRARKFDDVVKSAEQSAVLVLVY